MRSATPALRPQKRAAVSRVFALCAALALASLVACSGAPAGPVVRIETPAGRVPVRVELARSRDELSRGLMWRDRLDEDAGMLFVFASDEPRTFWMKNTPLPLDIIFVDAAGKVVSVAEHTTPFTTTPIRSAGPARYVLEVNAGFAERHGIRAGTVMELPGEAEPKAG
jgi:uncharacterized membrane protein (UPF0127 family)